MLSGDAKALHTTHRSSGVDVSDSALAEAWEAVRDDATGVFFSLLLLLFQLLTSFRSVGTNYCLFTYAEGSSPVICVHTIGEDGLSGLEAAISEDLILFGGIRVQVGGSVRFCAFMRIGENVGGMKRGKAALHKNAVLNVMEGISCEINVNPDVSVGDALREAFGDFEF